MNVKTDTKEKFTVVTLKDEHLPANMAGELSSLFQLQMNKPQPHMVVNLGLVNSISREVSEVLLNQQQVFYENHFSFVLCCLTEPVENFLEESEILEILNLTPTESEAWDIIQMEEIEREIMGGED